LLRPFGARNDGNEMSNKTYRNILLVGLGVVMVFAPLAFGAVQIWSIALIEAVVLLLVFLWLWRGDKVRKTAIDIPIWLFVGLAGVSCVFSIYKYASVMEMMRLLTMVGVFYLVVNNFDRRMRLRLAGLIIIMGTGMSLLGLGQYFLGLEHSWWKPDVFLASTYVNHNHFAGYLEMVIPLAVGLLFTRNNKILPRIGLAVALMIMFFAFIFAQSRGAWICLAISLIIMNIILIKRKVLRKESLVIFLILIALGVAYIYAGYDNPAERLRTEEEINNEGFIESRVKIWQGSIRMIKDNPFYGTGIGTFVWGFPPYRPQALQVRARYAHNDYLHMMAELGLLALPLVLWMIGGIIKAGLVYRHIETDRNLL